MDKLPTLSSAIRLGATFNPQCHGAFFWRSQDGSVQRSCALGAAWLAIGGDQNHGSFVKELGKRFNVPIRILTRIIDWNDRGLMQNHSCGYRVRQTLTRQQIADRLQAKGY